MAQTSATPTGSAPANAETGPANSTKSRRVPDIRGDASPARLTDETAQGKTTIASSVVQKIPGIGPGTRSDRRRLW
ncbi:hypothetical protein MOQ72_39145 [Saccharopolyspora sp. K220]|uniref:hypothetical protein n=1 Tax=Saccharopolyspora soli TaxID=2926618 RepID=UPI001F588DD1|nr:hypothetical protein [Saccharopolyspora soli]MCI2423445.1 hypothetical protein [Saccharopolyspora soli]